MSPTMVQQSPVGHGLLTMEALRSYSDTPNSVCLLWTSDQPDAEISPDNTQDSQQISIRPTGLYVAFSLNVRK
jgi:hypothetical protein